MGKSSIRSKLASGTLIILTVSILSKLTSFITDTILAAILGIGAKSDAYYMVSGIQQVLFPMISIGIWKVFLPYYKSKLTQNDVDGADLIANKTITFFELISLCLVLFLVFFSDLVVSFVAPGFDVDTHQLSAKLVRISAPKYLLIAASAIYASMLQARERFFASQIREIASYIPTIIAALFFYHAFGIEALAIALVIGGCLRLLIEIPFVNWKYHFKPNFSFHDQDFVTMLRRLPSALIAQGVHQLNALVDKVFASLLPIGSVTGLSYGIKLNHVFNGLLSNAIATAVFPQIIEMASLNKKNALALLIKKIVNLFSALIIPISTACAVYSVQIVTIVFKRGNFDERSVYLTAGIFMMYSLSLYSDAINEVLINTFYAYGDSRKTMHMSILHLMLNVGLDYLFVSLMGINGLPLGTSLSSMIILSIYMYYFRRHVQIDWTQCGSLFVKILISSIVAIFPASLLIKAFIPNAFFCILAAVIISAPVFFLMIRVLKIKEYQDLYSILLLKIRSIRKHE